jgi:hypothetical protein
MRPMPPIHPAARIFPMLPERELQELADDIKANGQSVAIILWRGQLLDGRNRWMACERGEIEPKIERRDSLSPAAAIDLVISLNIKRRHLDESQRAMAAARVRSVFELPTDDPAAAVDASQPDLFANLQTAPVGGEVTRAAVARPDEAAAELLHVSPRSVAHAKIVLATGIPELQRAVDDAKVAVSTAADVARLPAAEQHLIVAKGEKEILETAKRLRKEKQAQRKPRDAYASAGGFVRPLLPVLGHGCLDILECCAGNGDLVAPLVTAGHCVVTADIDPAAPVDHHLDMRLAESWASMPPVDWVVSNLPFNVAIDILPKAVEHARVGVAVILRLTFLEPVEARAAWLAAHPLTKQIVLPRYSFTGDGNVDSVTCAWMIYEKGKPGAVFIPIPDEQGMPGDLPSAGPMAQVPPVVSGPVVAAVGHAAATAGHGAATGPDLDDEEEESEPVTPSSDYHCNDCNAGPGELHGKGCDDEGSRLPTIEEMMARGAADGWRAGVFDKRGELISAIHDCTEQEARDGVDRWQKDKKAFAAEIANPDGVVVERRERVGKTWATRREEPKAEAVEGPLYCRAPNEAEKAALAREFPDFVKPLAGPPPLPSDHIARTSKRAGALIKHAEGAIAAGNFDSALDAIEELDGISSPNLKAEESRDAAARLRAIAQHGKAQPEADEPPAPKAKAAKPKASRTPKAPADPEPVAITDPKLIKAIAAAYSGDFTDKIRKPIEIDGALWINMGAVTANGVNAVTLWRVVPMEEWSGRKDTYDSAELLARYESGATWRGDRTGYQAKQGSQFYVFTGQRRAYRWGAK